MSEENEEFEREMNYKSPSQVIGDSVAREFADGQEEEVEIVKYITVLDFEVGKVFQYESPENKEYEEYLSGLGHRLNNCEWMIHDSSEIITN